MDGAGSKTQWQSLLNRLKKEALLPSVVFNFSKKKCEECADYLGSEDLNAAKEKSQVEPREGVGKRGGRREGGRNKGKERGRERGGGAGIR